MIVDDSSSHFAPLTERLHLAAAGRLVLTEARHASTVILVRDAPAGDEPGIELFLLRRSPGMAFAPGFFVFPGGTVDPHDSEMPAEAWVGPSVDWWTDALRCDAGLARALVCAAIRETFEECGVVLAGPDAHSVVSDVSGDDWEADRLALLDGSRSFADIVARRGLVLRTDLLHPWAHWMTPKVELRRYDTRFFLAAMPAGQRTREFVGESDRFVWAAPADAIVGVRRGELAMLPPTERTIAELADYRTLDALLAAAATREVTSIQPVLLLSDDDQIRYLLPDDPDHPDHPDFLSRER